MKTVERIVSIKNFILRKNILGLALLLIISFSSGAAAYKNNLFTSWVAKTDAVSTANTTGIKANTQAIKQLQSDIANKLPVVIVQKVVVPEKPVKHVVKPKPKPHGVLTQLKNFLF